MFTLKDLIPNEKNFALYLPEEGFIVVTQVPFASSLFTSLDDILLVVHHRLVGF